MIRSGLRVLQAYLGNPFRSVTPDPARLAEAMALPYPEKTYAILFTPRSGSTWLVDLLRTTGRLGTPGELFNPRHLQPQARACGAGSMDAYLRAVPRQRAEHGVFGFKLTHSHIRMTFRREARFVEAFPGARFFWLIREDIVAQAVSGARMVQTGVPRMIGADPARRGSDDAFRYRPFDLRLRIGRLSAMERRTEAFFARFGIDPVRLSYERLVRMSKDEVAGVFARELGVALEEATDPSSRRQKVGTGKSAEFAARFREANGPFLARIDTERAEMLRRLEDL